MKKIKKTIKKHNLINAGESVIVGVSGGADSIALLHYLYKMGVNVSAAHFNHKLRERAEADSEFVQDFCAGLGVTAYFGSGDVGEYAKNRKMSVEAAGRELRYNFFAGLANKHNAKIATAHNANDSAESIIMHLLRGSGRSGLCGIAPRLEMKGMTVIRPMINTARSEIEEYIKLEGLSHIEDETNTDVAYFRNDVRHNLMPLIYKYALPEAIGRAGEITACEEEFLNKITDELIRENVNNFEFDVKWFNSLHIAQKRRVLHRLVRGLTSQTVGLERIDAILQMCEKNYGGKAIELPDGLRVGLDKGVVKIER